MAPNARADLQFIPSGQGVLIQVGYTVEVYALPSGARLGTVTTEHFSTALPSPDGSQLFIEQLVPGTNRSYDLTRWETKSGKLTGRVRFSDTAPAGILRGNNAIISPDGHWLLSFHPDPVTQFRLRATIHDLREMKKVAETPVFPIRLQDDGSAFSSDGRYFVTCTVLDSDADRAAKIPGSAQVWETATCKPVGDPLPHPNGVRTATFNESGRMVLTTGFDSTLRVWKIGRTRASAQILMHRPKEVNQKDSYAVAARWLAGGAKVATVAMGETDLRLWDPATGQATAHSSSVAWNSAFVSPSGK